VATVAVSEMPGEGGDGDGEEKHPEVRPLVAEYKRMTLMEKLRKREEYREKLRRDEWAADYLVKIVETVARLEYGTDFKRDIQLHRENRVHTIHASLAIEGNSLLVDEVTAVIEDA
jgi:hypothetical protein